MGPGFDAALNPGLLVEQRGGKLLVQSVIPGSPAEEAGIRRGDEIVSVNGINPGRSCSLTTWSSRESATGSVVTVRHGRATKNIELALWPMRQFAAQLWTGLGPSIPLGGQFSLGLTWQVGVSDVRVTGLLQGGAAANSGLVVGDRIVSIDSRPANDRSAIANLHPRDRRYAVKLGLMRNGAVEEITVESASLLDALSALSESGTLNSAHPTVVARSGPWE